MLAYKYLIVITHRELTEQYLQFFKRNGIRKVITKHCDGTSTDSMLNLLGVEKTSKNMFETLVRIEDIPKFRRGLSEEMHLESTGNGIAVLVSLCGFGGESSLRYFIGDDQIEKTEDIQVESKYSLIISVVEKGNADIVMEAGREAGARGGTIVKAKGTGSELAKFFGVNMSKEKDMVYIVASRETRDAIMRSIMEKAGANTPSNGVIFALPVDEVMGIRQFQSL